MSILQLNGIQFGNGTVIQTKYFLIPKYNSGTPHEMFFYQSAAPTGWTKSTSHDNKALRVVNTTGRGSSGTSNFTTIFNSTNSVALSGTFSGTVGNTTLTLQQIPLHTHGGGSAFNAITTGSSSPFRQPVTQPRAYTVRAETRVRSQTTILVPDRSPTRVPDSVTTYTPARSRLTGRNRQRRDFRNRSGPIRSRRPYTQPAYDTTQVPIRSRRPFTFAQPTPARNRAPFRYDRVTFDRRDGAPFSYSGRQRRRRRSRNPRRNRRPFTISRRVRRPVSERNRLTGRQRRQQVLRVPARQRRATTQPRSYSFSVPARQRREFRQRRQARSRQRREFRQRREYQQPRTYDFTVNQRRRFFYRQPARVRAPDRYLQTTNTQVVTSVIVPGGTVRGANTNAPATSSSGGSLAHNHGFTGAEFTSSQSLDLRMQYVDVILCRFD